MRYAWPLLALICLHPATVDAQVLVSPELSPWSQGFQGEAGLTLSSLQAGPLHQQRHKLYTRVLWGLNPQTLQTFRPLDAVLFATTGAELESLVLRTPAPQPLRLARSQSAWSGVDLGITWRPLANLAPHSLSWSILGSAERTWGAPTALGRSNATSIKGEWRLWTPHRWWFGAMLGLIEQETQSKAMSLAIWGRRHLTNRLLGEVLLKRTTLLDDEPWRWSAGLLILGNNNSALGVWCSTSQPTDKPIEFSLRWRWSS